MNVCKTIVIFARFDTVTWGDFGPFLKQMLCHTAHLIPMSELNI